MSVPRPVLIRAVQLKGRVYRCRGDDSGRNVVYYETGMLCVCVCVCVRACVRVCVWRVSDCLQRGAGGEGRWEATEREKPSQLPSQTLEEALNETVTQLATVHVL